MFQSNPPPFSEVKPLLDMAFSFTNHLNQLWNYFVVFSGVVIGWRFSAKEQWGRPQKQIVTGVYTLFAFLNGWALWVIYDWLEKTFLDINSGASRLGNEYPHVKGLMQQSSVVGGKFVAAIIYLLGFALVMYCVWGVNYRTTVEANDGKK